MTYIPNDPAMLLSFINMKLRDEYDSLSSLCEDLEADEETLKATLSAAGYAYDEEKNRFF